MNVSTDYCINIIFLKMTPMQFIHVAKTRLHFLVVLKTILR